MWGMPADNGGSAITGYRVRYRMSSGLWSNWMTVPGGDDAASHTITGLTNGVGYEIQVRAVNRIGNGAVAETTATPREGLNFAHFANGVDGPLTNISDIVLVNVDTSTVNSAIYFYSQAGEIIPADTVVDMTGDMESTGDGGVTVAIEGEGEITVSTSGEGDFVTGSVKVFSTGPRRRCPALRHISHRSGRRGSQRARERRHLPGPPHGAWNQYRRGDPQPWCRAHDGDLSLDARWRDAG